jgi:hypothetical protein
MPTSLTAQTAVVLIIDGFLLGVGLHFAGIVVGAIVGALRRRP